MIRHLTVDFSGNIYPVVHMCDRFARNTNDPALAVSCVILLDGRYVSADTDDDVPIYTVH
jgi:hypothetical protein